MAAERAAVNLDGCTVTGGKEEGVVACGCAAVTLVACSLTANAGPAVDASGQATVTCRRGCVLNGPAGGLWAWDSAAVVADGCKVTCDPTYALLVDGQAQVKLKAGCSKEWGGAGGGCGQTPHRVACRAVLAVAPAPLPPHHPPLLLSQACTVEGGVRGAAAEAVVAAPGVTWAAPTRHVGPPPEAGPFKWAPDPLRP